VQGDMIITNLHPKVGAEQVAVRWGMSVESVRRAARLGTIPSYKVGRLVRFDLDEVEKALVRRGTSR
jgi:excisionase family DNA binding protein